MHSVSFEKYPPQTDNSIVREGTRAYIRYYGLLVERCKWVVESDSTSIPEKMLRRYIAKLIDPLGFRGGEVETVKAIESQLEQIFDDEEPWTGEPFKLKTVIRDTGSHGGLFSRSSKASLYTFGGCGDRAGIIDVPHRPIPSDGALEHRMEFKNWKKQFDAMYADPQDGDVLEVRFEPAENALFTVAFNFERD